MINFIICDDNNFILEEVGLIIDQIFMSNKLAYRKHLFNDYNSVFFSTVEQQMSNKIYILDIETPSDSGIEVARIIRKTDFTSIIIFLTAYEKYAIEIIKEEFMILTFISKLDDYKKELINAINKAIQIMISKKCITFNYNHSNYTIPLEDILYITTDKIKKNALIYTKNSQFETNYTLTNITNYLDKNFITTHRSYIINTDNVTTINYAKNIITFQNQSTLSGCLSREFKKKRRN